MERGEQQTARRMTVGHALYCIVLCRGTVPIMFMDVDGPGDTYCN